MQTETLSATISGADHLVVHAVWNPDGLSVRFADGCQCFAPATDVLKGLQSLPTRVQIDSKGPLGVTLYFGKQKEFYPWDWLRYYGDPLHRAKAAAHIGKAKAHIGERVRLARKSAGLTQQDLALGSGVSRATIARIEADQGGVTLATLTRIAAALGGRFVDVF
ncbi:MAG: XRE family transcriptional regulator [Myxococcales bacterium]|nr:XRE family transcriptional regulator [Myxococcales bacterium]